MSLHRSCFYSLRVKKDVHSSLYRGFSSKSISVDTSEQLATLLKSAVCRTRVMHRPAPSLFYFPGLSASRPVYSSETFPWAAQLRESKDVILSEYRALRDAAPSSDYVQAADEHRLHAGQWEWNSYILKGKRQTQFALQCPRTVELLEGIHSPGSLMHSTPFSFAFFSTLKGFFCIIWLAV